MSDNLAPAISWEDNIIYFTGVWRTDKLQSNLFEAVDVPFSANSMALMNFEKITSLDSNGAYLIQELIQSLEKRRIFCHIVGASPQQKKLLELAAISKAEAALPPRPINKENIFSELGRLIASGKVELLLFASFLGEIFLASLRWLKHPSRIRWAAIFHCLHSMGYQAMGIVALLSFLIGVVLCYQMGLQLKNYGASIYVVDFLGIALLREFSPLLTAIIVAGRTGSAFAAQIGTMKLNQEIDALKTMGLSSSELLVLPKVGGLLVALPLLSVLAIVAGVAGGMFMAKLLFSVNYLDFLQRFGKVITLKTLILGMVKTPVFAFLIASIGCFQGLRVSNSAESVGKNTTSSVVKGIFMIIVMDALFSILYSRLGL